MEEFPQHWGESHLLNDHHEDVMVKRQKELSDVESHHTGLKFLSPPSSDEMGEEYPCILCGMLGDASELVRLEGTTLLHFGFSQ